MNRIYSYIVLSFCVAILTSPLGALDTALLLHEGDLLWADRAYADKAQASIAAYMKVLTVEPDNYAACWKIARSYFYLGDKLPETNELKDRHRELGEKGMSYAKRALQVNPEGIEGHYYYALSLAQYSIGISIVKALLKGLGPDYERHLEKVLAINKEYDYAGPLRAMGRYWYRLPWPKRDLKKSIYYLKESIERAPLSIRGYVYVAESYLKDGERGRAKAALEKALRIESNAGLEVDAKRWKGRAEVLFSEHF
jgi:tetratricopeptide (TPR) repeat protein